MTKEEQKIIKYLHNNPGSRNCEIANGTNLNSCDDKGGHKDFLTWNILQKLTKQGIVKRIGTRHSKTPAQYYLT
jgi:hypothetical protein